MKSYSSDLVSDYAGKKTDMRVKIANFAKLYELEARGEDVAARKEKLLDDIATDLSQNYKKEQDATLVDIKKRVRNARLKVPDEAMDVNQPNLLG